MTRGRALALLVLGLVVLFSGTLTVNAAAAPGNPAPTPPLPPPTLDAPCTAGSTSPVCMTPTGGPAPSVPCIGEGCIPQPGSTPSTPTNPGESGAGDNRGNGDSDCGITSIGGCITNAINAFFRGIVAAALNPLLDLLSKTLLTTPTPDSLPRIGQLWNNSWQILLASYGLLILIAGILVMSYETVQTRHSIKEIAPRIVVGFLAGALSLWAATEAIELANGLAQAVLGGGLDANSAGETLKNLVLGSLGGGIFIVFIGLFLAGLLIALLVTYVVRVALTVILIAGAPIALMGHALPQTEGIAYWWWKAFGGCLAIQVGQSLALITALRVFLAPGGFTVFGPTADGLVNLLVAIAIMYVLFKIPFWFLGSLRGGGGRSLLGSIMRGFIAYKTFGLLGGRSNGRRTAHPSGSGHGADGGRSPAAPHSRGRTTTPLTSVRRSLRAPTAKPAPAPTRRPVRGHQLALPLGDDWPEWKQSEPDGQYRLPLDVDRVKPKSPQQYPQQQPGTRRVSPPKRPSAPATAGTGQQLRLPLDLPKPARRTRPAPPKPGGES